MERSFLDISSDLLEIVAEAGAYINVPIESHQFYERLWREFHGSREDFLGYVRKNVSDWYTVMSVSPNWIQEAEWPFSDGRPMIFVGQVDIKGPSAWFHDDASFFLFWNPSNSEAKTVIQVA